MTLTELLNEAKKRTGSDPKTAEVIGVSKGALSGVRAGSRPLPIDAAERQSFSRVTAPEAGSRWICTPKGTAQ